MAVRRRPFPHPRTSGHWSAAWATAHGAMLSVQGPLLLHLHVTAAPANPAALEEATAWLAQSLARAPAVLVVTFAPHLRAAAAGGSGGADEGRGVERLAELLRMTGWAPRCGDVAWSAWGRGKASSSAAVVIELLADGSGFSVAADFPRFCS